MSLLLRIALKVVTTIFFSRVGRFIVTNVNVAGAAHAFGRLADAAADPLAGLSGKEIAARIHENNLKTAELRSQFPQYRPGPKVVLITCMDNNLDQNEFTGISTPEVFVIRVAGGIMIKEVQEMAELAVRHGAICVIRTTHTGCAAESADPTEFPALCAAVANRDLGFQQFLDRPAIKAARQNGGLYIESALLATKNGAFLHSEEV